ncbi:hypothetical protein BN12_1080008 [Nostocoides japonicum T1-X7]|uniref:Baseplate protein J-like domain-containing protein n=1 Tax=Nostocoides japonicum T1-X7 TaxID=1194083 RepID=A0A077LT44_9MICO|nr:hypothetical protein [Tetrasphaera japonica]CCH76131.1 hypothetical protein BN12_1080008 [Tetrasphaera japonica T1-X7]
MSRPRPRDLVPRPDPAPGQSHLRRRLADRPDLRDALLAAVAEVVEPDGTPLGSRLDVAGDPTVVLVAELWSRVADSVAAYTELAAGERYLRTAQDWTDLRRTTDLLGHRPTQRVAAHGWIRCTTDAGASPLVPAGTRVQAPGTPQRAAQPFEVVEDTQLRADWADLTVTAVPSPQVPPGSAIRLLQDPGWRPSDRVLLLAERPTAYVPQPSSWGDWLQWILLYYFGAASSSAVVGTVSVTKRTDDLGAFLFTMDRPLAPLIPAEAGTTYAAYRVRSSLQLARRLELLSYVDGGVAKTAAVSYGSEPDAVQAGQLLVVDGSAATPGIGIVVWNETQAHVTTVSSVGSLDWSVAPGTKHRVGVVSLSEAIPWSPSGSDLDVALVDPRVLAQHYELPALTAGTKDLRIHPRPDIDHVPPRVAVETSAGWELSTCTLSSGDTAGDVGGMLLTLGAGFAGDAATAPATANLVPIEHGTTKTGPLTLSGPTAVVPGPVTGDVDATGTVADSLVVEVAGVRFDEVPTLYGRGPSDPVYSSKIAADGRLVLTFGDGVHGVAPRGEVTATWRVGGGLAGELDATLVDTLLGSVRGVRTIVGVGTTTGAADQEDQGRMRRGAAARIRALDRAVSLADLADLALTVPGTSHSAAWHGAGPPGCPCGGFGLHVAILRTTETGARAPLAAELTSMAGYLDARRDISVGLCVCAGVSSVLPVTVTVAADPRRDATAVAAAVAVALGDPDAPLAPTPRVMGVPLDDSDVVAVVQPVTGVVGVVSLAVTPGLRVPSAGELAIGRTPAERYELLSLGPAAVVTS